MATAAALRAFTAFSVRPVTPRIGAEIDGIDLSLDLPDEVIAEVRQALLTYKVLFFRDQNLTHAQALRRA